MNATASADFAIAARLCNALVLNPGRTIDAVEHHCREALHAEQALFLETRLDPAIPVRWEEQIAHCRRTGLPLRTRQLLAAPLAVDGQVVAVLVVEREKQFDDADSARFEQLVEFIQDTLKARDDLESRKRKLVDLEQKIEHQAEILNHIHDSVITMDLAGYVTSWNRGAERLFGYTADEAIGQHILFIYAGEDEDEDVPFSTFLSDHSRELTVRRRKKSGELFWASITVSMTHDTDGNPNGMVGFLVDITERLETETQLRLHARIFERSSEAIIVTDDEFRTISVNNAFTDITGFAANEVIGEIPSVLKPCSQESSLMVDLRSSLTTTGNWQGELWDWRKDEEIFPAWVSINAVRGDSGKLTNYFIVMSDITERKEAEQQIYRLAYYDALTGLPNRALLYSLVEQALTEAQRTRGHGALLILDINRFKQLNDSFGHSAADKILKEISHRLSTTLRSEDVVARMGSDEFVIALFDIAQREHAGLVAQKILDVLAPAFNVDQFELIVTISIGIAIFPDDGADCETLIRNADVAMFRAKQQTNHGYVFYSQDMNLRSIERLKLETGLRRGLERGELLLHYQPQIDLANGRLIGAEALIRWLHPEHGLVPPGQFIPIAEESGLILPIGEWVIEEACRQISAWRALGLPLVKIAVNISSRQFRPDLPMKVIEILRRFGIDGPMVELELTESMLMHNAEDVIAMMENLRDGGLSLSLDDFGTGFSSLAYLKRFPIDKLKIDQSFVRGIPEGIKDMAIARTIINLAQNLELKVLAEGVETRAQADFLHQAGCDQMQGYLYSRPIPAEQFAEMLARTRSPNQAPAR